ncbi:LCP family protein [Jatrophihabitans fulvus]
MSAHGLPPHLDPRGRHRGGTVAERAAALKPVGRILGSILSIVLLVLAGYTWYSFRDLDNGISRLQGIQTGRQKDAAQKTEKDIDGTDQNILVVGNDDRSNMTDAEVRELKVGRDGGSLATDTMMIVHIPADGSRATLISLPRDAEVEVPGHGMNKLNAPYALGYTETQGSVDAKRTAGANLLLQTVRNLTGLTFDHYVQVDLLGFYRISKAIGGIPVTMCHAVNDTVAYNLAHGEDGGSGLVLPKGRSTISGVKALEFVRQRHNLPRGDQDRVKRQQYFLTATFRQITAGSSLLFKIRELGDALKRSIYFDGSLNLFDLAEQVQGLTADNIVGRTIPVNLQSGYTNPVQVKRFVENVINPPKRTAPKTESPGPTSPTTSARKPVTKSAIDAKCIN